MPNRYTGGLTESETVSFDVICHKKMINKRKKMVRTNHIRQEDYLKQKHDGLITVNVIMTTTRNECPFFAFSLSDRKKRIKRKKREKRELKEKKRKKI